MKPPEIIKEDHWDELNLPFDIGSGRSMFVETESGPTLRMKFFKNTKDSSFFGRVWFAEAAYGPPGHAHGGITAFVLDEAMGSCAWMNGYPCMAANLEIDFRKMVPIHEDITVECSIELVEKSKVKLYARLSLNNETLVEARGLFVRFSKDKFKDVMKASTFSVTDLSPYKFVE